MRAFCRYSQLFLLLFKILGAKIGRNFIVEEDQGHCEWVILCLVCKIYIEDRAFSMKSYDGWRVKGSLPS